MLPPEHSQHTNGWFGLNFHFEFSKNLSQGSWLKRVIFYFSGRSSRIPRTGRPGFRPRLTNAYARSSSGRRPPPGTRARLRASRPLSTPCSSSSRSNRSAFQIAAMTFFSRHKAFYHSGAERYLVLKGCGPDQLANQGSFDFRSLISSHSRALYHSVSCTK